MASWYRAIDVSLETSDDTLVDDDTGKTEMDASGENGCARRLR